MYLQSAYLNLPITICLHLSHFISVCTILYKYYLKIAKLHNIIMFSQKVTLFQKLAEEVTLPNSIYEARITLTPKPNVKVDIYTCITNSLCYIPEIDTTL